MADLLAIAISFSEIFGIYAIMSLSLNLDFGYAGLADFGKTIFWSLGAFMAGLWSSIILLYFTAPDLVSDYNSMQALIQRPELASQQPLLSLGTFVLGLVVAAAVSAVFGLLITYPALRSKPDYLAMILLLGGEILRTAFRSIPALGGVNGLQGIPNPFLFLHDPKASSGMYAITILVIFAACYIYMHRIGASPYCRLLKSIRDDEVASMSLGKRVPRLKAQAVVVASAMAGLAGALYVYYIGSAIPDDFLMAKTFDIWVVVMIGGYANNKGVVVGAFVMTAIDRITKFLIESMPAGMSFDPAYVRYIIVAVVFLLFVAFRANGLIPERPIELPSRKVVEQRDDSASG